MALGRTASNIPHAEPVEARKPGMRLPILKTALPRPN